MNIQLQKNDGLTTATLDETRLDASVAPEFKAAMEDIILYYFIEGTVVERFNVAPRLSDYV